MPPLFGTDDPPGQPQAPLRTLRAAIAAFTQGEHEQEHFELAAQRIQKALLDVEMPPVAGFELGVCAEPARLVGGDYIDVYRPASDVLVFGLGDASGKSLAAALNSLMLRYLIRGLVKALDTDDLVKIVTHANAVLFEDMASYDFITFVFGVLEVSSGLLRVVNAGHEPPLLLTRDAPAPVTLDRHDVVLGITQDARYEEESCRLAPGDVAVFYTDGLTEATDKQGEMFTLDGLKRELVAHRNLGAQALAEALFAAVKSYTVAPLRDDATVFVIRRA